MGQVLLCAPSPKTLQVRCPCLLGKPPDQMPWPKQTPDQGMVQEERGYRRPPRSLSPPRCSASTCWRPTALGRKTDTRSSSKNSPSQHLF
ncbi:hypothetical protein SRHO_G00305260 [Serrasalmus rhombeus]